MPDLYLGSDPKNVQYGGGFRMHMKKKTDAGWYEVGHFTDLSVKTDLSKKEVQGRRTAAKGTIVEGIDSQSVSLSCTAMELSTQNMQIAAMAEGFQDENQIAGHHDLGQMTVTEDQGMRIGVNDAYITRIPIGGVAGSFSIGETVTGGTSSATGKVAWKTPSVLELVDVSGSFVAGETVTGGTSTAHATAASVQKVSDIVVVNSGTPTIRYELGTDYEFLADEGMFRVFSSGAISGSPYVAFDYPATFAAVASFLKGGIANREVLIVTDKDNVGPRYEIYYPSVNLVLSGDWGVQTDDVSGLPLSGTIIEDKTQPGKEYGYIKMIKAA